MTGMLASVSNLTETKLVLAVGVDIIDLKQPALGALGALELTDVKQIVTYVNGQCPVSATVGDLSMEPTLVFEAVKAMTETGVDYIKIGFFPGNDWQGTLDRLAELTAQQHRLIAVLFADSPIDLRFLNALKVAGFTGVMVDTMNKQHGSLTELMSSVALDAFVQYAKHLGLLCGLAGSLRLVDIAQLLPYQVDYLGFRGALCLAHDRVGDLNASAVLQIKQALHTSS